MNENNHIDCSKKEQGASLVMALIILVVITLMSISGMRNSVMNLNVSQGFLNYDYAFQMAESGLRQAESFINESKSELELVTKLTQLNILFNNLPSGSFSDSSFWQAIDFVGEGKNLKIIVENYSSVDDSLDMSSSGGTTFYYKITSRGIDGEYLEYLKANNNENLNKAKGIVLLQSIYAKRY